MHHLAELRQVAELRHHLAELRQDCQAEVKIGRMRARTASRARTAWAIRATDLKVGMVSGISKVNSKGARKLV